MPSRERSSRIRKWWGADLFRSGLLVGGFAYAWFFSQGIPLWDDDFTSWFSKIQDRSLLSCFFDWVSPVSTQPQFWGFNERPLQSILYKLCFLVSGYESWSYFLYKSAIYAGLGAMIYSWALRLIGAAPGDGLFTSRARLAALAAAVFFLATPGPMAAHILHQDFAPTAELIFLALAFGVWHEIERTPTSWRGWPDLKRPEQRSWMSRWLGLAFVTYLGYKSKADLKLIPLILLSYLTLVRRKQFRFFVFPVAAMLLLAVPWGPGIFDRLPPFVPGSKGSEIGWMWQPASLERLRDFLWNPEPFNLAESLKAPALSLSGLLGPFLLTGLLVFAGWRIEAIDRLPWARLSKPEDRARAFVLLWLAAILLGTSALPAINSTFRVRYGILTMVPASILLGWIFGLFAQSSSRLPRWAVASGLVLFAVQGGINLNRSIGYRRDLGQVMVSVDQLYEYVSTRLPDEKLALLPDFRPYDYRPGAGKAFEGKVWLAGPGELAKKYEPGRVYVVSWKPSLWEQLEMVETFSGCRETTLFDRVFPCSRGSGAALMRYIGPDPSFARGEELRSRGDAAGARKFHEDFLARHPSSLAGHFVVGIEAFQLKDWSRSEKSFAILERYFPTHLPILYNHALALEKLQRHDEAIDRLVYITAHEPQNYAALIHLYWSQSRTGREKNAKETLLTMKRLFPNDSEVNRLLASPRN